MGDLTLLRPKSGNELISLPAATLLQWPPSQRPPAAAASCLDSNAYSYLIRNSEAESVENWRQKSVPSGVVTGVF